MQTNTNKPDYSQVSEMHLDCFFFAFYTVQRVILKLWSNDQALFVKQSNNICVFGG